MVFGWIKSKWTAVTNALAKTRSALSGKIRALFGKKIDAQLLEDLEEILYEADLGVHVVRHLINRVKEELAQQPEMTVEQLLSSLEKALLLEMANFNHTLVTPSSSPTVILIVGANGSGKTTSIAKLSRLFLDQNKTVMLGAADTFRAAAQEQLSIWADRLNVPLIRANYQADPAAVAYDTIAAAKARSLDVVIVDTAGRLENKQHLLRELEKVKKSCQKAHEGAPHEILMVLDATIGQNGIEQAKSFHAAVGLTGLILTKLDGSAKGGTAIAIQKQIGIPIKFIGTGETIDSLAPFDKEKFVHAMFFETEEEHG